MTELLTADEMAALDGETIDRVGLPGLVLMENAARGCVRALMEHMGREAAEGVTVVAGPGNNGGDGHAVARMLANRGIPVEVLLLGDPRRVRGDARVNLDLLARYGVGLTALPDDAAVAGAVERLTASRGVIVDALFGTGLQRELGGRFAAMVRGIGRSGRPVLAVDIPSGVDATTGAVLGVAVRADVSVTFCRPKLGHFLFPGAALSGAVEVVDIGIPEPLVAASRPGAELLGPDCLSPLARERDPRGHKGTYGHLLIIAGSAEMPGAAVLAADAALAAGVGLVTLAVPDGVQPLLRALPPEVIVRPLPAADGGLDDVPREVLDALLDGKTAVAIGPGVGRRRPSAATVRRVARELPLPVVIDADGLWALGGTGSLEGAPGPRMLTPHPGEAARLLGTDTSAVEGDRPAAVRRAAAETGAVVVLKGAHTLIAPPDGRLCLNPTGNPGMATAGSGDVLTGLAGALLARADLGGDVLDAARASVYLHGLAGDLAAAGTGQDGLRASHITRRVSDALDRLRRGEVGEAFHRC